MARRSNLLLLNSRRKAVLITNILLVYVPMSCRAGNVLQGAATSTISAVHQYAAPGLRNLGQYAASTRVGQVLMRSVNGAVNTQLAQAMLTHYNAWNGVRLQFTEIAESNETPYPEGLFQQYITAAQGALRDINTSASVFHDMVSHFKRFGKTVYGTRVLIIHKDTPKSGLETYEAAEKIVLAMEKESKVRDYSKLKQIRGDYNAISLVCRIEEAHQGALVVHYNVNGVELVFKRVSDSNRNPYSEELFQQYSTAAREALEKIDRLSNFPGMLSHFKPCARSKYGTHVFIVVTHSSSPKTGSETYETAQKIVAEMESKLTEDDEEELREIRGNYNGVTVVCRIERVQPRRRRRLRKKFRVGSDRRG